MAALRRAQSVRQEQPSLAASSGHMKHTRLQTHNFVDSRTSALEAHSVTHKQTHAAHEFVVGNQRSNITSAHTSNYHGSARSQSLSEASEERVRSGAFRAKRVFFTGAGIELARSALLPTPQKGSRTSRTGTRWAPSEVFLRASDSRTTMTSCCCCC